MSNSVTICDFINESNANILKGLVWICSDQSDIELVRTLPQS